MSNELYVAVGSPDALHSGVWKVWSYRDDLYATDVSCGMASCSKVSVHRSGIVRLANVENGLLADMDWDRDEDPRVIHRWHIPEVGTEDYTRCLGLFVPTVYVPERLGLLDSLPERTRRRILWVTPEPLGFATIVEFVRTLDMSGTHLRSGDDKPLGFVNLKSGSRVWAFARRQALPTDQLSAWQGEVSRAVFGMSGPVRSGDTFMTITSPKDFVVPVLRQIALGLNNFTYDGTRQSVRPGGREPMSGST